jgi:hypothetical protein
MYRTLILALVILFSSCSEDRFEVKPDRNADMKLFFNSLGGVGGGVSPITIPNISTPIETLVGGTDTSLTTIYWIQVYRSADFPEITGLTKDYLFIYSTHHNSTGGCSWGQGDNLDLSDFIEGGVIQSGASQETPFLYRIPAAQAGDSEELHFTYHPVNSPQQTRLWTSSGGSLTNMTSNGSWTNRGVMLPAPAIATPHTGYAVFREASAGNYEIKSMYDGNVSSQVFKYWSSTDGRNWTVGDSMNNIVINSTTWTPGRIAPHFIKNGVPYAVGYIKTSSTVESERPIALFKFDANYRNVEVVHYLGYSSDSPTFSVSEDGNTLYIYFITSRTAPNKVFVSTWDLTDFSNWDWQDMTDVEPVVGTIIKNL